MKHDVTSIAVGFMGGALIGLAVAGNIGAVVGGILGTIIGWKAKI